MTASTVLQAGPVWVSLSQNLMYHVRLDTSVRVKLKHQHLWILSQETDVLKVTTALRDQVCVLNTANIIDGRIYILIVDIQRVNFH